MSLQLNIVKLKIKEFRSSKRSIIRVAVFILGGIWSIIKTVKRIFSDENYRSILSLQLFNSNKVHQTTSLTFMDRYPVIFSACRDYFKNKTDLKILSFGCSTGEEVLTLRHYFPKAEIVGADINKKSLKVCQNLHVDNNVTFIYSTSNEIQKHGPYDAIFCMAVLQRKPHYIEAKGINDLNKIYPFKRFEEQIIELDKLIKPNGLMVIHYTQYSFMDTKVADKYRVLGGYNQIDYQSPVFDKNSKLIKNPNPIYSIFIKTS